MIFSENRYTLFRIILQCLRSAATENRLMSVIMPMPQFTVWYNTRCPVCNGGIDWQRNKLVALVRSGRVAFKDINEQPDALASYGASLDDVRRRLHATDEDGH